jgi:hypothetical protein
VTLIITTNVGMVAPTSRISMRQPRIMQPYIEDHQVGRRVWMRLGRSLSAASRLVASSRRTPDINMRMSLIIDDQNFVAMKEISYDRGGTGDSIVSFPDRL